MTSESRLAAGSVREFLAQVASAENPAPAGGSVVALTGAASAALLALVCGVLQGKEVPTVAEVFARASALQQRLLALVDLDAAAFRAFLDDKGSQEAVAQVGGVPLEIAALCGEVADLSLRLESQTTGGMLGDVRAARHLALAGLEAALDIAQQDVPLHADPQARQHLRDQIARLRRR